jgi:hypothetical protein
MVSPDRVKKSADDEVGDETELFAAASSQEISRLSR